jgi:hypothetical protein
MPPRKYVQDSQEQIYKTVGKGGRTRLKMVSVPIQRSSSSFVTPPLEPPQPPVLIPPTEGDDDGGGYQTNNNDPKDFADIPKKRGKVGSI